MKAYMVYIIVLEISDCWGCFCVFREVGRGLTQNSVCGTAMYIAKTTTLVVFVCFI